MPYVRNVAVTGTAQSVIMDPAEAYEVVNVSGSQIVYFEVTPEGNPAPTVIGDGAAGTFDEFVLPAVVGYPVVIRPRMTGNVRFTLKGAGATTVVIQRSDEVPGR